MITLDELLASRDARHALQQQLLAEHPGHTLVCTTVVVPGSVKRNQQSLIVAHAAVEALRKAFGVDQWTERDRRQRFIERDLPTGYEVYLVTPTPLLEAKLMAVQIEDSHPLGRLFDIDVIDQQGAPVPRTAVGGEPRHCLVCNREARYCMRMRWHSQDDIWEAINQRIDAYVKSTFSLSQMSKAKLASAMPWRENEG